MILSRPFWNLGIYISASPSTLASPLHKSCFFLNISFFWKSRTFINFLVLSYTLFYTSNAFFSTQPLVLLNFLWAELQILLRCCFIRLSIHHNDILFTFSIIVSISRHRSIHVVSMWSIFHFHFHFNII